jgi:subtilisin family serine protease
MTVMSTDIPGDLPEPMSAQPVGGSLAGGRVPHYTERFAALRQAQQERVARLRQLQERHVYFAGRETQPLDVWVREGENASECLVVADTVLVPNQNARYLRNDDSAAVGERLADYGYAPAPSALASAAFDVYQLSDGGSHGPFTPRAVDASLALRYAGLEVYPLYVVPTQVVIKSNLTPELPGGPNPPNLDGVPVWDDYVVAVIDTGITAETRTDGWLDVPPRNNPAGNVDPLTDPAGFLAASGGHGTFVSGIVQQVEPHARIRMYRPFTLDGLATDVDLANAITEAVDEALTGPSPAQALVINLSCGTTTVDGGPLPAVSDALGYALSFPQVAVVAAAGNNGTTEPVYPAASAGVVSVAGLTAKRLPATWSSYGDWVRCSTVGEGLVSTFVEGRESPTLDPTPETFGADAWASWIGTSFCAPQVSAMILSIAHRHGVTPREAAGRLLYGKPRIDGYGQVLYILPGA